jgi:hypothetical protein
MLRDNGIMEAFLEAQGSEVESLKPMSNGTG